MEWGIIPYFKEAEMKKVKGVLADLLVRTPWYSAFLIASVKKYRESEHWRLRAIELSPEGADEMFTYNLRSELPLWKREVKKDKLLILKIIFLPFSVVL
jgi:hypothetical protein